MTPVAGPAPKKRKGTGRDDFEDAVLQHFKDRAEERRQNKREETDDDYFGLHVAAVLKKLPARSKALARLRIEQILLDAEFPEPHAPPPTPPSMQYSQYTSHYN